MKDFIRGYPLFSLCGLNCELRPILKTLAAETTSDVTPKETSALASGLMQQFLEVWEASVKATHGLSCLQKHR